ncbi:uncharacterized protein TRIADDRAFT_33634 [Trichoplax adhaerens]|uniref:Chitobiosyldiphosphodolichol beta-mannosyltransferase n=1 Tax=Trichoplax adhaerens TaxID=10228 RepID=B3SD03_TRIAD|nr:hypothetical protein TRIADDRAFT_33634 [Trichoplax adhaerens]EDV19433.1 hypothetical protein TRIADDRAFT_33634 [Trichoplax adhaerens]|eukprot:XP_002118122.1 hypothetical protein TRIADDRAFT_33634 [Trichoplax adhaerens]
MDRNICVLVLGDIGRSPRMQYHSISLAKAGLKVDLVGYAGTKPHDALIDQTNIKIHAMQPPTSLNGLPGLLRYLMKAIYLVLQLSIYLMFRISKPDFLLLQNPPAFPTIAVAWFVCRLRGSKLVIDWHNYGYTILGLTLGKQHILVRLSKWYERFFGRLSDANFCVTNAMRDDLQKNWSINRAFTLYDRPPAMFKSLDLESKHKIISVLANEYEIFRGDSSNSQDTAFTYKDGETIKYKADRPALLISSTSWTEDEDFSILLNALEGYENLVNNLRNSKKYPRLICVITGKGPLKEYYQELIQKKSFKCISICTPWLKAEDYPKILGAADLGVCLHKSSSGLDLPMKVVDMFGCGLPVCAISFDCLHELVKHEENGMIFQNEQELCLQMQELLKGFPDQQRKIDLFRKNLKTFQRKRWEECWRQTAYPVFCS